MKDKIVGVMVRYLLTLTIINIYFTSIRFFLSPPSLPLTAKKMRDVFERCHSNKNINSLLDLNSRCFVYVYLTLKTVTNSPSLATLTITNELYTPIIHSLATYTLYSKASDVYIISFGNFQHVI